MARKATQSRMSKRKARDLTLQALTEEVAACAPLTDQEEDAYAHICLLADRQQTRSKAPADQPQSPVPRSQPTDGSRASAKAIRFLIAYFAGETARRAMNNTHCDWGFITASMWTDPQYRRAYDFVHGERPKLLNLKATSMVQETLDGYEYTPAAVRMAALILQSTDRKTYGKSEAAAGGSGGGPAVIYNINLVAPPLPKSCDQSATAPEKIAVSPQNDAIDV